MFNWIMSADPGFADTVLLLMLSFAMFWGGLLGFFAPAMASRPLTNKERTAQTISGFACFLSLPLALYTIVEVFV